MFRESPSGGSEGDGSRDMEAGMTLDPGEQGVQVAQYQPVMECVPAEMPLEVPVTGESFCQCPTQTDLSSEPQLEGFTLECTCGEDESGCMWVWDEECTSPSVFLSCANRKVSFHPDYSCGTAAIRGSTELRHGQHFWEIKMTSPVYGTDMMVGIGTPEVNLDQYRHSFCSMLGADAHSWGLSYTGLLHHKGLKTSFAPRFGQGSIIGLHLDTWHGTLTFYKNRRWIGVAAAGLRNKSLYPMVSSTAAKSSMKVISSVSAPTSLQYLCCSHLSRYLPDAPDALSALDLPPGLKLQLRQQLSWVLRLRRPDPPTHTCPEDSHPDSAPFTPVDIHPHFHPDSTLFTPVDTYLTSHPDSAPLTPTPIDIHLDFHPDPAPFTSVDTHLDFHPDSAFFTPVNTPPISRPDSASITPADIHLDFHPDSASFTPIDTPLTSLHDSASFTPADIHLRFHADSASFLDDAAVNPDSAYCTSADLCHTCRPDSTSFLDDDATYPDSTYSTPAHTYLSSQPDSASCRDDCWYADPDSFSDLGSCSDSASCCDLTSCPCCDAPLCLVTSGADDCLSSASCCSGPASRPASPLPNQSYCTTSPPPDSAHSRTNSTSGSCSSETCRWT